jgi:integrase
MPRGAGRVFLRGSIFWCAYFLRNIEHRESTQTSDAKAAAKFLRNKMREVGADIIGARKLVTPKQSRVTISEMVAALKAKFELDGKLSPQNKSELEKLDDDFGHVRAVELTAEMVDAYKQEKLAEKFAPATVNRRLVFLTRCYTLAIKRGHLHSKPPIELLPVSNARQGFFEDSHFRKVYAELPADLKDFALFAFLTAWRKSEVSCLRWKYLENGVLRIPAEETKNGVARSVVIAGELTEIIERRQAAQGFPGPDETIRFSEYIFHRDGQRITEFRKAWASACKRAGFAGRLFHDLRRSGVRNMIRAGVPQNVAMKISGHETVAMFKRYDICNDDDKRAAAESVLRYNVAQSASAAAQAQSNVVSMNGR